MRLNNAHTRQFLLSWAHDADFLCDGLDNILADLNGRAISLSAPLTYEACLNLTDEELQRYYEEFGLVKYYPDLSHERRAWLLWKQTMEWRWLGTPQTIEDLCRYIMDQTEVELHITDSLAFDVNGSLVHPELLNVFDAELSVLAADLPENTLRRVSANIVRFKNDRTQLRGFSFLFDMTGGGFDTTLSYTDGGNYETFFEMGDFTDDIRQQAFPESNTSSSATLSAKSKDAIVYDQSGSSLYLEGGNVRYEVARVYATTQDIVGTRPDGLYFGRASTQTAVLRAVLTNMSNNSVTFQRIDYRKINCVPYTFTYGVDFGTLSFTVTLTGVTGSGYITAYGYVRGTATVSTGYQIIDERDLRYVNGKFIIPTNLANSASADCYLNLTNLRPD